MISYLYIDKRTRIKNPKSIVFSLAIDERMVEDVLTRNNYIVEAANPLNHTKGIDLLLKTESEDKYIDVKTMNDLARTISLTSKSLESSDVDYYAVIIDGILYIAPADAVKAKAVEDIRTVSAEDFRLCALYTYDLTDDERAYYEAQKEIYKSYKLVNTRSTDRAIDEISSELYPLYYTRYNSYFRIRY